MKNVSINVTKRKRGLRYLNVWIDLLELVSNSVHC